MHSGGISPECRGLFFPFAPIFCNGRNYSPPLTDKRRIDVRGAGMQRAEQAEKAQRDSAARFDLWRLYFTARCHLTLTFTLEETSPGHSVFAHPPAM